MARKKKHPEHVNHERWLVSYADFITLLFAFFTTLYAISTVDQKKAGKLMYSMLTALNIEFFPSATGVSGQPAQGNPAIIPTDSAVVSKKPGTGGDERKKDGAGGNRLGDAMRAIEQELERLAQDPTLRGKVQVRREARGIVVTLSEAGFFESGSAELRPGGLQALERIAAPIAARPGVDVAIEGHTDNVPIRGGRYYSNWELSTARATFVIAYLTEVMKIPPEHLSAAGYANNRPLAGNETPEGRARNRRVDLVVSATSTPPGAVQPTPVVPEPTTIRPVEESPGHAEPSKGESHERHD